MVVVRSSFWGGENQQDVFGGEKMKSQQNTTPIKKQKRESLVSHSCEAAGKIASEETKKTRVCTILVCLQQNRPLVFVVTKYTKDYTAFAQPKKHKNVLVTLPPPTSYYVPMNGQ